METKNIRKDLITPRELDGIISKESASPSGAAKINTTIVEQRKSYTITQYPSLSQMSLLEKDIANDLCGYYAVYNALCFATEGGEMSITSRDKFADYACHMVRYVTDKRKTRVIDNLADDEMRELVKYFKRDEILIPLSTYRHMDNSDVDMNFIDSFRKVRDGKIVMILNTGADHGRHWLVLRIEKTNGNIVKIDVADSLNHVYVPIEYGLMFKIIIKLYNVNYSTDSLGSIIDSSDQSNVDLISILDDTYTELFPSGFEPSRSKYK